MIAARFRKRFHLAVVLGILLWGTGLGSGMDSSAQLEEFPQVKRIWLSTSRVTILPAGHFEMKARSSGELQVLKKDGERLEAGEVWALEMPQRLALEKKSIQLEEATLGERLKILQMDHEEQIDSLQEVLDDLLEQEGQIGIVLERKDVEEDEALFKRAKTAEKRLRLKIDRAQERLSGAEKGALYEASKERLLLEQRQAQESLKNLQRNSEIRTPIAGVLHLDPELWFPKEGREEGGELVKWVENGAVLGKVMNERFYEVTLENGLEDIGKVKRESLSLRINPQSRERRIRAFFVRAERQGGRDKGENLIFRVVEEDVDNARQLKERQTTALIYVDFDKPMHFVSKAWLLKKFDQGGPLMTWETMVEKLNPLAKVVAEGHDAVAVDLGGDTVQASPNKRARE